MVAEARTRLKEAFAIARQLTSEEAARQECYYNRKAGAVALQPGDVVMVCTDRFTGKWKIKDRWKAGGYVIVKQYEDWPVYKVKCPPSDNPHKAKFLTLHQNRLMLVPPEDDSSQDAVQLKVAAAIVSNANIGTILSEMDSASEESESSQPSLVARQGGEPLPYCWLNGEFRTKLWTQSEPKATQSPPGKVEDEVSSAGSDLSGSEEEEI